MGTTNSPYYGRYVDLQVRMTGMTGLQWLWGLNAMLSAVFMVWAAITGTPRWPQIPKAFWVTIFAAFFVTALICSVIVS